MAELTMGAWVVEIINTETLNNHPNPEIIWCPYKCVLHFTEEAAAAYMWREQQMWDTEYPGQYAFRIVFYRNA